MKKVFDVVNVVLLFLLTWLVWQGYATLPARIPLHFDMAGRPNRWGGKTELLVLVVMPWAITILFYGMALILPWFRRHPSLLSIPRKEQFLALSEEKQQVYWNLFKEFFAGLTAAMNVLWLLAVRGTILAAQGQQTSLPVTALWIGLALIALVLISYLPRLMLLPKKLTSSEPQF